MKKLLFFAILFLLYLPCLANDLNLNSEAKVFAETTDAGYTFTWQKDNINNDYIYNLYSVKYIKGIPYTDTIISSGKCDTNSVTFPNLIPGKAYFLTVSSKEERDYTVWYHTFFETAGSFMGNIPRSDYIDPRKKDEKGKYIPPTDTFQAPYKFTSKMFSQKGSEYCGDLALTSAVLAACSYSKNYKGEENSTKYLKEFYEKTGFGNVEYYNSEKLPDTRENGEKGLFAIGSRKITVNRQNYNLISIVVRGTVLGEWYGNFNIGHSSYHKGFDIAAKEVSEALDEYVKRHNLEKADNKIWLCGHSRGAAVANILSHSLLGRKYVKPNNIYCYTIASPNVISEKAIGGNAFNFINSGDFVPCIPYWDGWTRYGKNIISKDMNKNVLSRAEETFQSLTDCPYIGYSEKNIEYIKDELNRIAPSVDAYYNIKFNKSAKDGGRTTFESCNLIANLAVNPKFKDWWAIPNEFNKIITVLALSNVSSPKIINGHSVEYYYSFIDAYNRFSETENE